MYGAAELPALHHDHHDVIERRHGRRRLRWSGSEPDRRENQATHRKGGQPSEEQPLGILPSASRHTDGNDVRDG